MAAITVTAADVRPLQGSITIRAVADEALTVGDLVYVDAYTGNIPGVKKTVATAIATSIVLGMVVAGAPEKNGSTSVASGDIVDVAVLGPVTGFSGATAGGFVWASDTAGVAADAVGTKSAPVGFMLTPTTLFIRPFQATRSA